MRKALTFRHQKRMKQLGLARGMFAAMDTDGSGEISRVELRQNLSVLGLDLSAETTFDIVEQIDVDHNGEISEQEFVAWMESNVSQLKMGLVVCAQRVDSQRCAVALAIAC
jgi:Ca2+-binding EF-hand superfamily protein